jgi:hypothetical protein
VVSTPRISKGPTGTASTGTERSQPTKSCTASQHGHEATPVQNKNKIPLLRSSPLLQQTLGQHPPLDRLRAQRSQPSLPPHHPSRHQGGGPIGEAGPLTSIAVD